MIQIQTPTRRSHVGWVKPPVRAKSEFLWEISTDRYREICGAPSGEHEQLS
jgi:hypothetical protein